MKTINKIMVAIDFSDYSFPAAKYAVDLAQDVSASVLFSHVFNKREVEMIDKAARRFPIFSVEEYIDENLAERKERLKTLVEEIGPQNIEVDLSVSIGVPYEALLNDIEENKPDLLIMGIKGRSNLIDVVTGSCTQKLFRRSPIPLLTIRKGQVEKT